MSSSVSRRSFAVLAVGASLSATAVNAAPITLLSEDWETHQGNPPATWTFNNAANTSFSTTAHQSSTMLTMTAIVILPVAIAWRPWRQAT